MNALRRLAETGYVCSCSCLASSDDKDMSHSGMAVCVQYSLMHDRAGGPRFKSHDR